MKKTDRENPVVVALALGTVAAVALTAAASAASRTASDLLDDPKGVLTLVGALVIFAPALLLARHHFVRRALKERVRMVLVPTDSFDPSNESVLRFASALSRIRRPIWGRLLAPASAIRIGLDLDPQGQLRYWIEIAARSRSILRTAVAAFDGVELRELPSPTAPLPENQSARSLTARLELALAHPSPRPLRDAGLDPDPLVSFAKALSRTHPQDGDDARVCIDLLPITSGRRRRRLLREARRSEDRHAAPEAIGSIVDLDGKRSGPARPSDLVKRRSEQHALMSKLGSPETLFSIQVLVRSFSKVPAAARSQSQAILACFDTFAGSNHFRAVGVKVPGVEFLGSDLPGRRGDFDRRVESGRFRPRRRRVVTATEIAGLLKPPTSKCKASNVLRSGGAASPPPPGLPTFSGQSDLLPLGVVESESGERMVGVPLEDTFFFYGAGRSRFGKTELAVAQIVHLARAGEGCFFLDPHADGVRKVKGYLAGEGLRDRVVEIDLDGGKKQPGWNLFDVSGLSPDRLGNRVDAVAAAFASAMGWSEINTRALNLTTQSAQALTDLARALPPHLAPTIFQIPTLLGRDDWREAVLPFVSPATRQFFVERFPRLPADAITPVTNVIDRLRASSSLAALLGNPISTYDVRAAMDDGQIVLIAPGSGGARERLVANLFVFDLFYSAKTRRDLSVQRRRPFNAYFDECQIYDGPSGELAAFSEQSAKFGMRGFYFNQNPERLTPATLNAITTNRSHVATTAVNSKAAKLLAQELGGEIAPETVGGLGRFEFLTSVTLDGEVSDPFRIRTVPVDSLFDPPDPDDLRKLDPAIDKTAHRIGVDETLASLADHDERILDGLARTETATGAEPAAGAGGRAGEWTPGGGLEEAGR